MTIRISKNRVDIDNEQLQNPALQGYSQAIVTANSGTSYAIDLTSTNYFNITLTGNCTFTFTNPKSSGTESDFTLILAQDSTGGRTITWPSSVKWTNGSTPTASTTAQYVDWYTFRTVDGGTTWYGKQVGAGIRATGTGLWSWGKSAFGQLGLNDGVSRSSPVQIGTLSTWSSIVAGSGWTSLGIKTDGTLWVCGSNADGELGLGDILHRSSPVQVGTLTTWSSIAGGKDHSVALKTDGTLWAWGRGDYGMLGLGDAAMRSSPVQVGTLTTWSDVTAGNYHTIAIKTDGTLWAWGMNTYGNLGIGDVAQRSSPVQVGTLTTWSKISGGYTHTHAIKTDGTLWAWGVNDLGNLGLGDKISRSSPVQVGTLTTWSFISKKSRYGTAAIKTDGTMWAWGYNDGGRLGTGDTIHRSSPVQMGTLTTWSKVGIGAYHGAAIKTDGTLWTWGSNTYGQIGANDTTGRSSPVQIGTSTSWSSVSAGEYHTVAIKSLSSPAN